MPETNRLTARTSAAWASMSRLRWITPIPPACAMAMAMRASVTVSIAEDSSGMFSPMLRVTRVRVSAVEGRTEDAAGTRSTSSKVSASRISIIRPPAMEWRVMTWAAP